MTSEEQEKRIEAAAEELKHWTLRAVRHMAIAALDAADRAVPVVSEDFAERQFAAYDKALDHHILGLIPVRRGAVASQRPPSSR